MVPIQVNGIMKCLVPRCKHRAEKHHWPVPKSKGGDITVPLCKYHHRKAHEDNKSVLFYIIQLAPYYWITHNTWRKASIQYYKFLAAGQDAIEKEQNNG